MSKTLRELDQDLDVLEDLTTNHTNRINALASKIENVEQVMQSSLTDHKRHIGEHGSRLDEYRNKINSLEAIQDGYIKRVQSLETSREESKRTTDAYAIFTEDVRERLRQQEASLREIDSPLVALRHEKKIPQVREHVPTQELADLRISIRQLSGALEDAIRLGVRTGDPPRTNLSGLRVGSPRPAWSGKSAHREYTIQEIDELDAWARSQGGSRDPRHESMLLRVQGLCQRYREEHEL